MFYSDYGVIAYRIRLSSYILRFARHYVEYCNAFEVRVVDYDVIVWC